ncbi:alpha/beta hydrolase [Leeia sp. TBRC 13508]|uniref:Alpha/beta hydrolase n=1 Tax=Leeia speluncae TaxID=2884804 RepID=A0ABS8DA00_9NEIS|nr:alpha/beta hydrolase [Leeia speluncae]MCB6185040.1 alpha/beta hydrolase [Leeia speluncae]
MSATILNSRFIVVPGWKNSGPLHWQSSWANSLPNVSRVYQENWQEPQLEKWLEGLNNAIEASTTPAILIAHSLGCITATHWVKRNLKSGRVKGLFLVAPADIERANAPKEISQFAPILKERIPVPTHVIASTNDPFCQLDRAKTFAKHWEASLTILPDAFHINAESGHQTWNEGKVLLYRFTEEVSRLVA